MLTPTSRVRQAPKISFGYPESLGWIRAGGTRHSALEMVAFARGTRVPWQETCGCAKLRPHAQWGVADEVYTLETFLFTNWGRAFVFVVYSSTT